MKKSTANLFILALIILLHEADQIEGYAAGPGNCMQPVHRGSLGGNVGGNKPAGGNRLEVSVGQQKCNGDHWNVKYTKNPNDHNINVKAGGQKPKRRSLECKLHSRYERKTPEVKKVHKYTPLNRQVTDRS